MAGKVIGELRILYNEKLRKKEVKLSRYMPWRHMGGKEV
jgi:hypothetical protein